MVDYINAETLVRRLESSPQRFVKSGAGYALLQEYFKGYPVETLRPWLVSDDYYINKLALFIASELGDKACSLVQDVLPFFSSNDPEFIYYALDVVIVCSHEYPKELVYILHTLNSTNESLRRRAMFLVSRMRPEEFLRALRVLQIEVPKGVHIEGLSNLVNADQISVEVVRTMIAS